MYVWGDASFGKLGLKSRYIQNVLSPMKLSIESKSDRIMNNW
jgi:hypothetical protein